MRSRPESEKRKENLNFFKTEKTCIYGNVACSNWIGKFTTIKYEIFYFCLIEKLGHAIYSFKIIPIKSPMSLFCRRRSILLFIWTLQEPQIANTILKKKNKCGSFVFPDFKTYYKLTVTKKVWRRRKDTHSTTEQNRPPISTPSHVLRWLLTRVARPLKGKRAVLSTNGVGKLDIYMQKNDSGPLPYPIYKKSLHLGQNSEPNIGAKTVQL